MLFMDSNSLAVTCMCTVEDISDNIVYDIV